MIDAQLIAGERLYKAGRVRTGAKHQPAKNARCPRSTGNDNSANLRMRGKSILHFENEMPTAIPLRRELKVLSWLALGKSAYFWPKKPVNGTRIAISLSCACTTAPGYRGGALMRSAENGDPFGAACHGASP